MCFFNEYIYAKNIYGYVKKNKNETGNIDFEEKIRIQKKRDTNYNNKIQYNAKKLSNKITKNFNPKDHNLKNLCQIGKVEPIWEKDQVTETYCRCPDNGYGFTCTENFINPCVNKKNYNNADERIGNNYFIKCDWGVPYLLKCPPSTR